MRKSTFLPICLTIGILFACQQQMGVDDVVSKVTEATGGAEKIMATTDQVSTWEFTMHILPPDMPEGVEGPMISPLTITAKRPNKLRMDSYGPDGSVVFSQCYDGTTGWITQMGQKMDMTEAQSHEFESMAATWIDGFLNVGDKGYKLKLLPNETVEEQNYLVLQITDKYGTVQKQYINPQTYFVERSSGNMVNNAGELEAMVMTMDDYKMVDGFTMPHYVAQYNEAGELIWEAKLKEVRNNTGVEDATFMTDTMSMK